MSGRAKNAGKAVITLSLDDRVARGLKRVEARFKQTGANIARVGKVALAVGGTIVAAFFAPIKSASALEETMNKFNVVFGENAGVVKKWGDNFAAEVGRSEKQIADFMGSTQDLFVPLGFEAGAATEMSKQITGLALDLASFNNSSDDSALRDLQAALTGSGEVMKKYGVLVSEAAVKQQLLADGLDPKVATDQQKVQARLNIIMAGTTAAQGDAIRSAGSYANQVKALKGSLSDVAAKLGGVVLPYVTQFVGLLRKSVVAIGKFISENAGIVKIVAAVGLAVGAAGAAIVVLGTGISLVGVAIGGIASLVTVAAGALAAILSPLGLVAAALAGLATWFITATETGKNLVKFFGDKLGGLLGIAKRVFGGISDAIAAGDIKAAMALLWAGINLIWLKGTQDLTSFWINFKESFLEITANLVFKAAEMWANLVAEIKKAGIEAKRFGQDAADIVVGAFRSVGQTREEAVADAREVLKRISEREQAAKTDISGITSQRDSDLAGIRAAANVAREANAAKFAKERSAAKSAVAEATLAADAAFKATQAVKEDALGEEDDPESIAAQIKAVLEASQNLAANGVSAGSKSGAVLDARFAGQQFGGRRSKEEELLLRMAESRDRQERREKARDLKRQGIPLVAG